MRAMMICEKHQTEAPSQLGEVWLCLECVLDKSGKRPRPEDVRYGTHTVILTPADTGGDSIDVELRNDNTGESIVAPGITGIRKHT